MKKKPVSDEAKFAKVTEKLTDFEKSMLAAVKEEASRLAMLDAAEKLMEAEVERVHALKLTERDIKMLIAIHRTGTIKDAAVAIASDENSTRQFLHRLYKRLGAKKMALAAVWWERNGRFFDRKELP